LLKQPRKAYVYAAPSTSRLGPIEEDNDIFFKYFPLAEDGFALTTSVIKALKFSANISSVNSTLPIAQCTIPALSVLY